MTRRKGMFTRKGFFFSPEKVRVKKKKKEKRKRNQNKRQMWRRMRMAGSQNGKIGVN